MNLSTKQRDAINHLSGPALVLAVPGAGKTTVLVHRTHNLVTNHNIDPEKILSITFSKASALDMNMRFNSLFPHMEQNKIHFSTIHSFCYGFIREYAYINRISYKLIEGSNSPINKYSLLKQIYLRTNNEYITEDKLDNLINAIGYVKNMMLTVDEFLKNNKVNIDNFKELFVQYEAYKAKNNLLDFDDILGVTFEALSSNKYLLDKYQKKYDFIQVDEGQDTSKVQMEIIKLIAQPKDNLFIVADDDQSIYGFRGAYPKGLLNFSDYFKNAKIFFMEENYRSSQNIVATCNNFIKSNRQRYEKHIFTNNDYIKPINIVKVHSIGHQYDYLLKDLKDKKLSETCILYRGNLSSIGLIDLLERNQIPFTTRDKKLRFFNHWLIKDVLDILKFSQDTTSIDLFENFYYKIKGYISKKHINYTRTLNPNLSVFDRILDYPGINNYYQNNLKELKKDFKKISKLAPYMAIEYIEENLEYREYLKDASMKFGHTYDNLNTIMYFLKMLSEKTSNYDDFTQRLRYIMNLCSNPAPSQDSITLSTVHSSKGLEFENVYIIDLIDGEFPTATSVENYEKGLYETFEEERRLFYVGMSRAKSNLTLITYKNLNSQSLLPSRFLKELDKNI